MLCGLEERQAEGREDATVTQQQAISHALYLLTASRGANARLTEDQECIVRLAEIIGVEKESQE